VKASANRAIRAATADDAVAATLGFPSLAVALLGTERDGRLLVLDNCEHVRDAAADTAERLLDGRAELTVLATSREPLDLPDERVVPLSPLALPSGDDVTGSPAVDLLLTRARDGGHELVLDGDGAAAVAALCRRLDGLPLALELAAARTRSLTPAEILAHLDSRHAVLGRNRGPHRHRSLDAAIGWSYDGLPDPTARFFDRLGVFAGRFTADEARAVAGDPGTAALWDSVDTGDLDAFADLLDTPGEAVAPAHDALRTWRSRRRERALRYTLDWRAVTVEPAPVTGRWVVLAPSADEPVAASVVARLRERGAGEVELVVAPAAPGGPRPPRWPR
ncbi:MAG: hypothetical protein L0H64_23425, partial [Pseudonocardia sp.]|nr:hypothetical protein [Pseudonocardia sp.]